MHLYVPIRFSHAPFWQIPGVCAHSFISEIKHNQEWGEIQKKKFSFFNIMGMQGSFVDFFESRGYYVHILVTENKMMSVTNLHQLSKYKEEVIWVVK